MVRAVSAELRDALSDHPPFWVEAAVGTDNLASQKEAKKTIPQGETNHRSGIGLTGAPIPGAIQYG